MNSQFKLGRSRSLVVASLLLLASCGFATDPGGDATNGSSGSSGTGSSSGGTSGRSSSGGSSSGGSSSGGSSSGGSSSGGSSSGGRADGGGGDSGNRDAGGDTPLVKFAGNITTRGAVRSDFAKYWNQITPENEGKWGSVQPSQGSFNWKPLDDIYKYANDNNIIFKEHCFVWGAQQPGWVNSSNAKDAVRTWMKSFCERYPKTKLIDVVNEPPPHTTPSYKDGMGGDGTSGYDWIANAFKWAREFCPNSVLLLNDYNTIEYDGDNSHIIDIVKKIKTAGAPIDAVGVQAHATSGQSADALKKRIDAIATQTGLPIYVTEFDLPIADDNQQKAKMQEHFTMFWNNPNIKGVTLWGYVSGATWVSNSGLISDSGTFRPSMTWLMNFLGH